jgi:isopenicillin-N epimerase
MNAASFGITPRVVDLERQEWLRRVERHTEAWFREDLFRSLAPVYQQFAKYIDTDPDSIVFVRNATFAVNALLNSRFAMSPPPKRNGVITFAIAYPMVQNALKHLETRFGTKVFTIPMTYPVSNEELVAALERTLVEHKDEVQLALFDHISSSPSMLFPVKEMTALCHKYGVEVAIDGAHTPGHIDISMRDIGAEYYFGNIHKWLYTPRGCAFLYVDPKYAPSPYFSAPTISQQSWGRFRRGKKWRNRMVSGKLKNNTLGAKRFLYFFHDQKFHFFQVIF